MLGFCSEDDAGQNYDFCFARDWSSGVFAGAHGEEEACDGDVCRYGGGRVTEGNGGKASGFEQETQQLGGDGLLAFGSWVGVIIGSEQGTQGRSHVGASRDVKGAVLEMVPERRSQTACGTAHSACDHWVLTVSGKFSFCIPASVSIEAEERSKEKLLGATAQAKEVGVIGDASFVAEVLPSPPDSVVFFVCVFLPGVKDDSAVCSMRMTQYKTSCGRGNISKERGI